MTDTDTAIIKMTGRAPLRLRKSEWPIIARASERWHDGQVECQANRSREAQVRIRKHADGRTIVYGWADYATCHQGAHGKSAHFGRLFAGDPDLEWAMSRAHQLAADIGFEGEEARGLADRLIADLPAEEI